MQDTISLVLLKISIEYKVIWLTRWDQLEEELDIWLFSFRLSLYLDRWPIRLEVSKHDFQTELSDEKDQARKDVRYF